MLEDLYRELIMDHYRHPQNRGRLENPTVQVELHNPLCGDELELQLIVKDDTVEDVRWPGRGCSLSQSSASMMSQALKGMARDRALKLVANFQAMMHGEDFPYPEVELGDLEALSGVAKFPVRIKCALLAWEALSKALNQSES